MSILGLNGQPVVATPPTLDIRHGWIACPQGLPKFNEMVLVGKLKPTGEIIVGLGIRLVEKPEDIGVKEFWRCVWAQPNEEGQIDIWKPI